MVAKDGIETETRLRVGIVIKMVKRKSNRNVCKGNLNPKRDSCGVPNPMNCTTPKQCLLGHSITHTKGYQKAVGCVKARCEHDRTVKILEQCWGADHLSRFVCVKND